MSEKRGVPEECLYCHNHGTRSLCPVCGDAWLESKRIKDRQRRGPLAFNPKPAAIPQIAGV